LPDLLKRIEVYQGTHVTRLAKLMALSFVRTSHNPCLSKALPALAAEIMQARVSAKYGLRIGVIAILHTFNGELNFNAHVHTMVTGEGCAGPQTFGFLASTTSRTR
jgi:hypothetical protein